MPRMMSDAIADKFIIYAVFAWLLSCVYPPLGLLLQFPAIIILVRKCDVKGLPALLLLMLSKSNFRHFAMFGDFAVRLGITLTPSSLLSISTFVFTIFCLIKGKYDSGAKAFSFIWLLSAIPAAVISFKGKQYGLSGAWSGPIMAFLVPGMYYWGLSMASTYDEGREYLVKRLFIVLLALEILYALQFFYVYSMFHGILLLCLALYIVKDKDRTWGQWKFIAMFGIGVVLVTFLFARRFQMEASIASNYYASDLSSADKYGSTFSAMGNLLCAFLLSIFGRKLPRSLLRILPILMVVVNICFVSHIISTQSGNKAHNVNYKYYTLSERIEAKLYGDRANVWSAGWEEVKTPPYVFKDMRQAYYYGADGKRGIKLLPHNQYITLLARQGLWLGGVLSIFIIWVWLRAFKAMTMQLYDSLMCVVFVPVGAAIYFIVGITGQSVVSAEIWSNALPCIIMPAIVYGHWLERGKWMREEVSAWRSW